MAKIFLKAGGGNMGWLGICGEKLWGEREEMAGTRKTPARFPNIRPCCQEKPKENGN